jgi:hypothetical protein
MVVTPMRTGSAANAGLTVIANPTANNVDINLTRESFADGFTGDRSRTMR